MGSGIKFSSVKSNYTSKRHEIPPEVHCTELGISEPPNNCEVEELSVESLQTDHAFNAFQNVANDEQPTIPVDQHAPVVVIGDVSPTSNTTLPKAPPSIPLVSKREIKLVTTGSSATDWFTHGICRFISKKEYKDPQTFPITGQHKTESVQTNLVNLTEQGTKEQENDSAGSDSFISKMTGISGLVLC